MRGRQGAEQALGRLDRSGLSHTNPQIPESGHMRASGLDLSTFVLTPPLQYIKTLIVER